MKMTTPPGARNDPALIKKALDMGAVGVGFGCIAISEIEVPIILVNMV
jgi:hypothetical protein